VDDTDFRIVFGCVVEFKHLPVDAAGQSVAIRVVPRRHQFRRCCLFIFIRARLPDCRHVVILMNRSVVNPVAQVFAHTAEQTCHWS
jgi:hypothetical protein